MADKKKQFKGSLNITKKGKGKPTTYVGSLEPTIRLNKNIEITPKARNIKSGDFKSRKRGLGLKLGDYTISGSRTRNKFGGQRLPTQRELNFIVDNLWGGQLRGGVQKRGREIGGDIKYEIPIGKVPILGQLLGYRKKDGGRLKRPKGVKIAQRGFGRAMKNGK